MSTPSPIPSSAVERLRKPRADERVYRDECMFTFDTPYSEKGLYVNLHTFQAFAEEMLALDQERNSDSRIYLHSKWRRVPKKTAEGDASGGGEGGGDGEGGEGGGGEGSEPAPSAGAGPDASKPAVTKFAIGVEGGFQTEESKWDVEKTYAVVVLPEKTTIPYPSAEVPAHLSEVIEAVLHHEDSNVEDTAKGWEEKIEVTAHFASLIQVPGAPQISPDPSTWQCANCDKTDNLWLNLSDGHIGCGRRNFDGTGGNGHAMEHYEATNFLYPLCVKLGTITPKGGDVFSYDKEENDLVEDPNLAEHLKHFGINMMSMEKTEKSMAELNIAVNENFEFSRILETGTGKELVPRKGPGFVGLKNLGNSCYMNSVLQVLLALPEFAARYLGPADAIFRGAPADPASDFVVQAAKLAVGVLTDKYVHPPAAEGEPKKDDEVAPLRFKTLVGRGHPEFSTGRQQDAMEYYQHLLQILSRSERTASDPGHTTVGDLSRLFSFEMEDRLLCKQSGKVRYTRSLTNALSLSIPLEAGTNHAEVAEYQERIAAKKAKTATGSARSDEEPVRLIVPFEAVLSSFGNSETISNWMSPVTGATGNAEKTTRLATMPPYLMVHLRRYVMGEDWTPKKLDALVRMPDTLSLDSFRGSGLRPGEEELPESGESAAASSVEPDASIVMMVQSMGFGENAAKRAAIACNNSSAEAASEWVLSHLEDPDLNDPLPPAGASGGATGGSSGANPESIMVLTSMGFAERHAVRALNETGGSVERAADWLFSRADTLDSLDTDESASEAKLDDGPGEYEMVAFISHMGPNTGSGHYVCHILKDGKWTLFNDSKVAFSDAPPKDMGFMYLYRRKA